MTSPIVRCVALALVLAGCGGGADVATGAAPEAADRSGDAASTTTAAGAGAKGSTTSSTAKSPATSASAATAASEAAPISSTVASGPATTAVTAATAATDQASTASSSTTTAPSGPTELSRGSFQSLEVPVSGTAVVVKLADGSRVLRFEGFRTNTGPDLRVVVSSAALSTDWYVWGQDYLELGALQASSGAQEYAVPAGLDLARYGRVVIWCEQFDVGFGVADIG